MSQDGQCGGSQLWFKAPLGVEQPWDGGHLRLSENIAISVKSHNGSKITVMN